MESNSDTFRFAHACQFLSDSPFHIEPNAAEDELKTRNVTMGELCVSGCLIVYFVARPCRNSLLALPVSIGVSAVRVRSMGCALSCPNFQRRVSAFYRVGKIRSLATALMNILNEWSMLVGHPADNLGYQPRRNCFRKVR